MYKDDALTRYTRAAGQQIMAVVMSQPQGARSAVVREALESIKPGLHAKVDKLAWKIAAGGISTLMSYEEALRLSLADVFVDSVNALARAKQTGRVDDEALDAQRMFYGDQGTSGLGTTAKDVGNFFRDAARAAACSPEVRDAIMSALPNDTARTWTSGGLSVAKSVASCNSLPGATPPPPPAVTTPPPPPPADNTALYVVGGIALVGVGVALFLVRKSGK